MGERVPFEAQDPVSVYGRTVVPIVRTERFFGDNSYAAHASPVAVVVIDGNTVYFVPLAPDMDPDMHATILAEAFGITAP